mmetsp:Transcript_36050/g.74956  ORF Transcript_36050/g.74956 Transcript_36050/m.74956 type:complete len:225 (+) Transcript_36050:4322-4996(+)
MVWNDFLNQCSPNIHDRAREANVCFTVFLDGVFPYERFSTKRISSASALHIDKTIVSADSVSLVASLSITLNSTDSNTPASSSCFRQVNASVPSVVTVDTSSSNSMFSLSSIPGRCSRLASFKLVVIKSLKPPKVISVHPLGNTSLRAWAANSCFNNLLDFELPSLTRARSYSSTSRLSDEKSEKAGSFTTSLTNSTDASSLSTLQAISTSLKLSINVRQTTAE